MELEKNRTEFSDEALMNMARWCMELVGCPPENVKKVAFLKKDIGCCNGRCFFGAKRITVTVGHKRWFPRESYQRCDRKHPDFKTPYLKDQYDALVSITAHELTHLRDGRGHGERKAVTSERIAAEAFNKDRERLLKEWGFESA